MALIHQQPFATVSGHLLNRRLFHRITVADAAGRIIDDLAGAMGAYSLSLPPGTSILNFSAPNCAPVLRVVRPRRDQALALDVALAPAAAVLVKLRTKSGRSPDGACVRLSYGDGTSVSAVAPPNGELLLREQPTGIPVTFTVEVFGAPIVSTTRHSGFRRGLDAADFVLPGWQTA